ncbi:hypothetical protein PHMEG_00034838 [Phytophthora megakarya]|uniref:Reverse transcriptase n=1 Tax=Phytophthora megakarya TaxID=4795 RepID=A0A225UPY1_9STRA|nr:hypothetical protein PHMEG_00034838 [Phytophthora megakarya]
MKMQLNINDHQTTTRTKFVAGRQTSLELDPVLRMINDRYADRFATNESHESSLVPVFQRRNFGDDICFGGTTFDDSRQVASASKVDSLSHDVSPEGIQVDPKKMTAITKLPFLKSTRLVRHEQLKPSRNRMRKPSYDSAMVQMIRCQRSDPSRPEDPRRSRTVYKKTGAAERMMYLADIDQRDWDEFAE